MSEPIAQAPALARTTANPLAAGFFVGYLVVQLIAPAIQQFAIGGSGFAWKMYTGYAARSAPRLELLLRSGERRLLDEVTLRRYMLRPGRIEAEELWKILPRHLCRLMPEVEAVRMVWREKDRTTSCATG